MRRRSRLQESIRTASDLLFFFPRKYQDFSEAASIETLEDGPEGEYLTDRLTDENDSVSFVYSFEAGTLEALVLVEE